MLDLTLLRRLAVEADAGAGALVPVTGSLLRQVVAEIEAGRAAQERAGIAFGLPQGTQL